QLEQVGEQVGEGDGARPDGAEVDNAARGQVAQVVGQTAAFQRFEQAAHQGGLAHAAAPHHGQQPPRRVAQKVGDEPILHVPVLKVAGGGQRRRVDKAGGRPPAGGPLRPPLALQAAGDALFRRLRRRLRVARDGPLPGDGRL
ncbi:hypothetical protein RZS08_08450, partial [Arthrospira platensis SPKY1]|nr:hypothetical protein [Arthrospira platensis SPKY1]